MMLKSKKYSMGENKGLSGGAIASIVIAVIFTISVLIFASWVLWRKIVVRRYAMDGEEFDNSKDTIVRLKASEHEYTDEVYEQVWKYASMYDYNNFASQLVPLNGMPLTNATKERYLDILGNQCIIINDILARMEPYFERYKVQKDDVEHPFNVANEFYNIMLAYMSKLYDDINETNVLDNGYVNVPNWLLEMPPYYEQPFTYDQNTYDIDYEEPAISSERNTNTYDTDVDYWKQPENIISLHDIQITDTTYEIDYNNAAKIGDLERQLALTEARIADVNRIISEFVNDWKECYDNIGESDKKKLSEAYYRYVNIQNELKGRIESINVAIKNKHDFEEEKARVNQELLSETQTRVRRSKPSNPFGKSKPSNPFGNEEPSNLNQADSFAMITQEKRQKLDQDNDALIRSHVRDPFAPPPAEEQQINVNQLPDYEPVDNDKEFEQQVENELANVEQLNPLIDEVNNIVNNNEIQRLPDYEPVETTTQKQNDRSAIVEQEKQLNEQEQIVKSNNELFDFQKRVKDSIDTYKRKYSGGKRYAIQQPVCNQYIASADKLLRECESLISQYVNVKEYLLLLIIDLCLELATMIYFRTDVSPEDLRDHLNKCVETLLDIIHQLLYELKQTGFIPPEKYNVPHIVPCLRFYNLDFYYLELYKRIDNIANALKSARTDNDFVSIRNDFVMYRDELKYLLDTMSEQTKNKYKDTLKNLSELLQILNKGIFDAKNILIKMRSNCLNRVLSNNTN